MAAMDGVFFSQREIKFKELYTGNRAVALIRIENYRGLSARIIEIIIGAILLLAGLLKAYQPLDFIQQIGDARRGGPRGAPREAAGFQITAGGEMLGG